MQLVSGFVVVCKVANVDKIDSMHLNNVTDN